MTDDPRGRKVLSDEQLAKVNEWFASKDVSDRCESCGQNDWAPAFVIVAPPLSEQGKVDWDSDVLSMFQMLCRNCGFIRLYSAGMIGLP